MIRHLFLAKDINANEAMSVLLKEAILPNCANFRK